MFISMLVCGVQLASYRTSPLPTPPSIKFIRQEFLSESDKIGRNFLRQDQPQTVHVSLNIKEFKVSGRIDCVNKSFQNFILHFWGMYALRYFSALEFFLALRNSRYQDNILMSSAAPLLLLLSSGKHQYPPPQHFLTPHLCCTIQCICQCCSKSVFFARF